MLDGKYSAEIFSENIPMLPEAYHCASEFVITAGGQLNRNYLKDKVDFKINDFPMEEIMFDPQTSGGLLISLPEKYGTELLEKLNKLEIKSAIVGKVVKRQEKDVIVL